MHILNTAALVLMTPTAVFAAPPSPVALAECTQLAQNYLEMTKDKPPANSGQKNARALVQTASFTQDCARQVPAKVRACMIAAKTPRAWSDCLKPKKPTEVEPAGVGLCTRPAGKYGPVIVTRAEYDARQGVKTAEFSKLAKAPIEVCGVAASQRRLRGLRCDDGSSPFGSGLAVASARVGNVGQGGRCKSMIDHYQVKCPEKTYDVHIDMYWCRPGMWRY